MNCIKLGRECPGYPDQLDLLFKHETANVTRKATRGKKQRSTQASSSRRQSSTSSTPKSPTQDTLDPTLSRQASGSSNDPSAQAVIQEEPAQLSAVATWDALREVNFNPSVENVSIAYFFSNVVSRPSATGSNGFFDVLIPLFSAAPNRSPLHMATEAIAVRTVATLPGRSRDLFEHADRLYGMALQATQQAINDPQQALTDETLLTILLFALYESVSSPSITNWSKHVQGAVSIAKARGTAQFEDPQSLVLFRATRTQMLMDAVQRRASIDDFPGPEGWTSDHSKGSICSIKSSMKMPGVLARAKNLLDEDIERTPANFQQVDELLREAYDLQNELYRWDMNMPAQFGYKSVMHATTVPREDNVKATELWPGPVHDYRDVHTASIRNNNRVSQLLCSNVVIGALRWLDPDNYMEDRRYRAAVYRVQYLVDDIAASVPFNLGYSNQPSAVTNAKQRMEEPGKHRGAYFLIWPLYVSAQMRCISILQRKWLNGRLDSIAERYGLHETDLTRVRAGAISTDP
ncbi:hypothetical protein PRZ48_002352 [Zasmidium cellare]|uniref:Uncharacterized protein n=1 Tax=Zasmidium cellare TaxID=395010 RepID=A0ABR0F6S3_ZASCE|nr:hypothetical protein PRZ48_002352 [Zasmidium cellare]